jgi:hypothetical protein
MLTVTFKAWAEAAHLLTLGDEGMGNEDDQRSVCARFGAAFLESSPQSKVGIALNTLGHLPLNGLRHPPEGGTCGWYIWAGESFSTDPNDWNALHVSHLAVRCADALPYLGLAPGWRFLIAPGYEDVWYDESLLKV